MAESESGSSSTPRMDADSQLDRTVLRLREMIFKGAFRPGERISEHPLALRIGVSRTPVRLALERLAHEGLLEPYPTGGFIVRKFTLHDIWDGIEVRGLLEGGAARLAAERLENDRELDPLRKYQRDMDNMGEPTTETFADYLGLNEVFHAEIVHLAKNEILRQSLDRLFSLPFTSPKALASRPKWPEASQLFVISQEHHHRIIEAIEKRQGTRAENLAREHAQFTRRNFEMALADTEFLRSFPLGLLIAGRQ